MNIKRLKWVGVLTPAFFAAVFVYTIHSGIMPPISRELRTLLVALTVLAAGIPFSRFIFYHVDQMGQQVRQQAERAGALLEIAQAVNSSLETKVILQRAVDLLRKHLDADLGEIHFLTGPEGEHGVRFSGLHKGQCPIKAEPTLRGLNGEVLRTGRPLRLADRTTHPHSVPLPEGHPAIGPFLGVPVIVRGQTLADILLIRAPGARPFTQEDENFLQTVAHQVAVALENAQLYNQVRYIATLEERDRLGREIHDGLVQTLAYLNLQTRAVADLIAAGRRQEAEAVVQEVRRVIKDAYEEARRIIFDLRAASASDLSFIAALREYLYEFGLQSQIDVQLEVDDENLCLPPAVEVQLTRIIQEALTNVRRHAQANHAWVRITGNGNGYRVSIADDGQGLDANVLRRGRSDGRPHFGLQTMRERAESIGGQLHIVSPPNQGTEVIVDLPTNGYERQIRETERWV